MKGKFYRLFQLLILAGIAFGLKACQEFIHDSFDTLQGVIVDVSGNPVAGLELNLFSQNFNFFDEYPSSGSPIYAVTTNEFGEFKMVVPTRNRDFSYYLVPPSNLVFNMDQFGTLVNVGSLNIQSVFTSEDRVIDLGRLTVLER